MRDASSLTIRVMIRMNIKGYQGYHMSEYHVGYQGYQGYPEGDSQGLLGLLT